MTAQLILPDPACSFGYTLGQVQELLGGDPEGEFLQWLSNNRVRIGQCTSLRFNRDTGRYEPSECSPPHGPVVYPADLHRFMQQAAA